MANECVDITLEKIRAELDFGGQLIFRTPDIQSFSVNRSRTQLAAQFSASIEIPADTVFPAGQDVSIRAGTEGNLKNIFTGKVLVITVNPSFEDATTYIANLSGQDRFNELENQTFSRRQRTRGKTSFATITGIASRVPQKGVSTEKRIGTGGTHRIRSPDTNLREHSKLVFTDRVSWDPFSTAKDPTEAPQEFEELEVIDIIPKSLALSPGVSARFEIQNSTYETGDSWSVNDEAIGTIEDKQDGTAVVTMLSAGQLEITFTKSTGGEANLFVGKAAVVGIPIHDHSNLGQGGPAFAVFGSE
jgi:hypothetical protein